MSARWIRTDEATDVAGSLRHVIRIAPFVEDDPLAWKWVILALHSLLQGVCVCHLTTTAAPVGALTEKNTEEWLTYFEKSRNDPNAKPPGKTYLMTLPELLKALRKPNSAGSGGETKGIAINDSELRRLTRFNDDIRNQFVHFEPMGWSLNVSEIPEIAKLIARIVEDVLSAGWAFRHLSNKQREEIRSNLRILASLEWPKGAGV